MEKSAHKLELIRRIEELEKKELWHLDVEDDPETYPLMPDKVDYLIEKPINKLKNKGKKGGEPLPTEDNGQAQEAERSESDF